MWVHIQLLRREYCWCISTGSCLTTLIIAPISLWATIACLPSWRISWDHSTSTIMSYWKMSGRGWAHMWQISLTEACNNFFTNNINAPVLVVTTLKSSSSTSLFFFVYNIFSLIALFSTHLKPLHEQLSQFHIHVKSNKHCVCLQNYSFTDYKNSPVSMANDCSLEDWDLTPSRVTDSCLVNGFLSILVCLDWLSQHAASSPTNDRTIF
jgi:hypothetical protein